MPLVRRAGSKEHGKEWREGRARGWCWEAQPGLPASGARDAPAGEAREHEFAETPGLPLCFCCESAFVGSLCQLSSLKEGICLVFPQMTNS